MTEFCDGCPIAGACIAPIEDIRKINLRHHGRIVGYAAVLIDRIGNASDPLKLGLRRIEHLKNAIDNCEGPAYKNRLWPFREIFGPKKICPALGHLAMTEYDDHYEAVKRLSE
jgi:hypothetical protein